MVTPPGARGLTEVLDEGRQNDRQVAVAVRAQVLAAQRGSQVGWAICAANRLHPDIPHGRPISTAVYTAPETRPFAALLLQLCHRPMPFLAVRLVVVRRGRPNVWPAAPTLSPPPLPSPPLSPLLCCCLVSCLFGSSRGAVCALQPAVGWATASRRRAAPCGQRYSSGRQRRRAALSRSRVPQYRAVLEQRRPKRPPAHQLTQTHPHYHAILACRVAFAARVESA